MGLIMEKIRLEGELDELRDVAAAKGRLRK
jgi:hypothetical protein